MDGWMDGWMDERDKEREGEGERERGKARLRDLERGGRFSVLTFLRSTTCLNPAQRASSRKCAKRKYIMSNVKIIR